MQKNRALNVMKNLNYLLSNLEQISAQKLLEHVPNSEYDDIYIKFDLGKNTDIIVSLFNSNTRCIVRKVYTFPEILRKCSDIFTVMEFINEDIINLYIKSKERIFNENTVVNI
jgi:hypothetical protein